MLEQKESNKNIIEELNDIENKSEEVVENNTIEGCNCGTLEDDNTKKPTFLDSFKASIVDLIVIGGVSVVGVFVVDAILRLAGFFIAERFEMSFVVFMVVMVLYMSIMESGKTSATIGKKLSGLIITKK